MKSKKEIKINRHTHVSRSQRRALRVENSSLQQNFPFEGKGGHCQQNPRATSIQPMDHRELRDRHRPPKDIGAASRESWNNIVHLDSPNSNMEYS